MTDGLASLLGRAQRGAKRRRKEERRSARKDMLMAFGLQAFGAPIAKGVGDLINAPYRNPINSFLNDPEGRAVKGFGESLIRERAKINDQMEAMNKYVTEGNGSREQWMIETQLEPMEKNFLRSQKYLQGTGDELEKNYRQYRERLITKDGDQWTATMNAKAKKELNELVDKHEWFKTIGTDDEIRASRKKYDPTPKGLLSSLGRFATRKFRGQTNEEYEENAMRNMLGNMGLGADDVNAYFKDDGAGRKAFIKDLKEATKYSSTADLETTITNLAKTNPNIAAVMNQNRSSVVARNKLMLDVGGGSLSPLWMRQEYAEYKNSRKEGQPVDPVEFYATVGGKLSFDSNGTQLNDSLKKQLLSEIRMGKGDGVSVEGMGAGFKPIIEDLTIASAFELANEDLRGERSEFTKNFRFDNLTTAEQKAVNAKVDQTLNGLISQAYEDSVLLVQEEGFDKQTGQPKYEVLKKLYGENFTPNDKASMSQRQRTLIYDTALYNAHNGALETHSVTKGLFNPKEIETRTGYLINKRNPVINRDRFIDSSPQPVTTPITPLAQSLVTMPGDIATGQVPIPSVSKKSVGKGGPGTASGTSNIAATSTSPQQHLADVATVFKNQPNLSNIDKQQVLVKKGKDVVIHAATNPNDNPLAQQKGQSLRTPVKFKQGKATVTASFNATGQLNISRTGLSMADRKRSITYKEVAPNLNDAQKNQVLTMASALRMIEEEAAERFGSAEVLDDPTIFSAKSQSGFLAVPSNLSKLVQERNDIAAKIDLPGLQDKQEVISFLQQSYGDLGAREEKMLGGEADVVAETLESTKAPSMLARPEESVNEQTETSSPEDIINRVAATIGAAPNLRELLSETAQTESKLGTAPGTYKLADDPVHGKGSYGLMQVDEKGFHEIQRRLKGEGDAPRGIQKYISQIKDEFGFDPREVEYEDLKDDTKSVIFARLYYAQFDEPIASTREGRSKQWKRYYNTDKGAGTPEKYLKDNKGLWEWQ